MTRPVSEPQRVKNDARRSENQAKAPVSSHEMRSLCISEPRRAAPVKLLCEVHTFFKLLCEVHTFYFKLLCEVHTFYHKPEGVVHKPFNRGRTAKMYVRGHSI